MNRKRGSELLNFLTRLEGLKYWILVNFAGYSTGLFLWAINHHPKLVSAYFLQNSLSAPQRIQLVIQVVSTILLFNIVWLIFSYIVARINHESLSASLRKDALTFSPMVVLLLALIAFPDKMDNTFIVYLFILIVSAVVGWKAWLLDIKPSSVRVEAFCDKALWALTVQHLDSQA